MSSKNEVPQNEVQQDAAQVTPVFNAYTVGAQALIVQARDMRLLVPKFILPATKADGRRLANAANLPPQFVELTAVAMTNSASLARPGAADPLQTRDLMSYAEAYAPFADELEAFAQFVRHSVAVAKNKVGRDALVTYALAKRLAKLPETVDLAPHVVDMTRALGKRGRKAKTQKAPVPATPVSASPVATSPAKTN